MFAPPQQRVFVTGGDGLLGSHIIPLFQKAGIDVCIFEGDVRDRQHVLHYAEQLGSCDWIIHTAAITDLAVCEKDRGLCMDVNLHGTRHIRDLAQKLGAHLLYISTVSVFSGQEGWYHELDIPRPAGTYDLSKCLGEEAVLSYVLGHVVRINIIGVHPRGSRGTNFFEWLIDSFMADKDMRLFRDVIINPLSPRTIAECLLRYIQCGAHEMTLHLGSTTSLSKADIGRRVAAAIPLYRGHIEEVDIDTVFPGQNRPKYMTMHVGRATQILSMRLPTLEEEVDSILTHIPIHV